MVVKPSPAEVVKFSPANVAQVNVVVQSDFDDLLAFIKGLLDMPKQRPNSEEVRTKLKPVIETFGTVAQAYFGKAQELLDREPAQPRLQKYGQVLSKVQTHALRLSELVLPDPDKEFSPSMRRQLFNRLIATIASRTSVSGQPFILPVLGKSFKYVNYNYVDGFGVLCLPPRLAALKASNRILSIFWHETSAQAIAAAKSKHRPKFDNWTNILHERLKTSGYLQQYNELYRRSLLSSLNGRDIFEDAGILEQVETLIRDKVLSDPDNVDGDGSWEGTLFAEFLEDMNWTLLGKVDDLPGELADGVVKALAGALAATYKNLRVGDPKHPSPHLRILVAINYLCNGDQKCIDQRIAAFVGAGEDIFGLQQDGPDRGLAQVIATVCQEVLDEQDATPWLFKTAVTPLEREIASDILNGRPISWSSLLDSGQGGNPAANQIVTRQIDGAQNLEALLAIEFTTDDPFPLNGSSGWPPPEPPPGP